MYGDTPYNLSLLLFEGTGFLNNKASVVTTFFPYYLTKCPPLDLGLILPYVFKVFLKKKH